MYIAICIHSYIYAIYTIHIAVRTIYRPSLPICSHRAYWQDLGVFMSTMGACFLISEAVLLPVLVPIFGEWLLTCVGLGALTLQMAQIGLARDARVIYVSAFYALMIGVVSTCRSGSDLVPIWDRPDANLTG